MGRGWMLGCSDRMPVDGQADKHRGRVSRRALSVTLATALTLLTVGVGSALAAQQVISTAGPIDNIYLNDTLECQATHVGDTHGEFFGGTNPGSCGTALATGGTLYGVLGTGFTTGTQRDRKS